ncbi:short transient receptor potential channel 6-like [Patiria miniata]|uniref:Transient receptor ion channel domain-containing protein n=1 Tax=Patiria miniata TaxID=46514 RepID=A0A914AD54_PATMI|nr:short transient receptor potential channel 6-like [Patiria miniata]
MDNEAYEMEEIEEIEEMEKGRVKRNGSALSGKTNGEPGVLAPAVGEARMAEEMARYEEVKGVAQTGNGRKLDTLLGEWQEQGWLRDWRNEENMTLYADAITDSFLDIINVLLQYDIPLGDALIRAIDVDFEDAIKAICQYLSVNEDICDEVLSSPCDNGDFHPALTPLVLAAQRNSYGTAMLLLDLGAEINEPSISLGGEVTLTQAISTLHVYRAISQPAYILATQTDIFGYAFAMTAKLQSLSRAWTDFGAELEELAQRVEVFAGDILGKSASSGEILALFGYHNNDKYRDKIGRQHPLSKVFEGIMYEQKEFIAHPHSQKAIIGQFYRNLLSWNEQGFMYQILLMLLVMLGYPVICLLYIFFPVPKVVRFARNPYVMFLMYSGSGITFLTLIIALTVIDKVNNYQVAEGMYALLLVWILGMMWQHMKKLMMHGLKEYLSDSMRIVEAIIIALYVTVFVLQWNGQINIISNVVLRRSARHIDSSNFTDLQDHVSTVLSGFQGRLNDTLAEGVDGILTGVLSNCHPMTGAMNNAAERQSLTPLQQVVVDYDQFEPVIVAQTLFAVTIVMSFIRLTNILLVSETVGPLRISLGAMVGDILKFCAIFVVIWIAFAIGLYSNYYSAGQAASRPCFADGGSWEDCAFLTGFSTPLDTIASLYWSLFGMIDLDVLELTAHYSVAEFVGTFLFLAYHIVAVLVLLNALIGMLSNTYNLTEEHADTEWKFHRAAAWTSFLRPVGTLPPPFNLIPSVKSLFGFCRYIVGIWLKCARRKQVNRKDKYSKEELAGYTRALKLTRDRYVQDHLSSTSTNSEAARTRDVQLLRNDVTSFRFFAQDRLEALNKNLILSNEKSSELRRKLDDLDPLKGLSIDVVGEATQLTENIDELSREADGLREEQTTEITDRDQEAADLRDKIAALQAKIQQLMASHSTELAKRDGQEAHLSDLISGLERDKSSQKDELERLRLDKAELINNVGRLLEEIGKLQLQVAKLKQQIPAPTEEVPDEPEQERLGFFRRIANVVEKKITDLGEGLTAGGKYEDNLTCESEQSQTGREKQDPSPPEREKEKEPEADVEAARVPETSKKEIEVQKESSEQQMASPAQQVDSRSDQMPLEQKDVKSPRPQREMIEDPAPDTKEQVGKEEPEPEREQEQRSSAETKISTSVEAPAFLPDPETESARAEAPKEELDSVADLEVTDYFKGTEAELQSKPEQSLEKTTYEEAGQTLEAEETPLEADTLPKQAKIQKHRAEAVQDLDVDVEVEKAAPQSEQRMYVTTDDLRSSPFEDIDLPPSPDTPPLPVKEPKQSEASFQDQMVHVDFASPDKENEPKQEQDFQTTDAVRDAPAKQVEEQKQHAQLIQEPELDTSLKTPEKESNLEQAPDISTSEAGSSFVEIDLPSTPASRPAEEAGDIGETEKTEDTQHEEDLETKSEEQDTEEEPVIWQL